MLYFDILTTIFCTIKLDITPYRKQPSPSIGPIKKSHFTFLCCCVFLLDNKIDCPFLDDSMAKCECIMFEYCDWCSAPSTHNNNTMMANNLKKKQTLFSFSSSLFCVVLFGSRIRFQSTDFIGMIIVLTVHQAQIQG